MTPVAPRRKLAGRDPGSQLALFSIRAAWVAGEFHLALALAEREQRSREHAGRRGVGSRASALEARALRALRLRGIPLTPEIAAAVRAGAEARAACWG